jgi:hypothetical protein
VLYQLSYGTPCLKARQIYQKNNDCEKEDAISSFLTLPGKDIISQPENE